MNKMKHDKLSFKNPTVQSFLQVLRSIESNNFADGVNVRQVSSDSGCVHDIVERQLGDQWAVLQEQR